MQANLKLEFSSTYVPKRKGQYFYSGRYINTFFFGKCFMNTEYFLKFLSLFQTHYLLDHGDFNTYNTTHKCFEEFKSFIKIYSMVTPFFECEIKLKFNGIFFSAKKISPSYKVHSKNC